MKTLKQIIEKPSAFDSMVNYVGEVPESNWLCLLTKNRDSDALTRSNFDCALKLLGGESNNVRIDRFGHWACGRYETLSVLSGSKEHKIALEIETDLENYPVINEEHFSSLEYEEVSQLWEELSISERIELCQKYNINIFEARHNYLPKDENGTLI